MWKFFIMMLLKDGVLIWCVKYFFCENNSYNMCCIVKYVCMCCWKFYVIYGCIVRNYVENFMF